MTRVTVLFLFVAIFQVFSWSAWAEGKVIGVSWHDLSPERISAAEAAMRAVIEAAGDEFISGDASNDIGKQADDLRTLVERGADVLIVQPANDEIIGGAIASIIRAGTPVVVYDRLLSIPGAIHVAYDYEEAGRLLAESIINASKGPNVAILRGPLSDLGQNLILKGQMEVLGPQIETGVVRVLSQSVVDDSSTSEADRQTRAILLENQGAVNAFLATSETITNGILSALEDGGLAGTIIVAGASGEAAVNNVLRGYQPMSFWKDDRALGKTAAETATLIANGRTTVDLPGLQTVEFEKTSRTPIILKIISLQPIPITKDNLDLTIDAGWVSLGAVCDGVPRDTVAICRSIETGLPVVDVCFGSDRKPTHGDRLGFSHERNKKLTLGFARVSIPEDVHEFGRRERPEKMRFLWLTSLPHREEVDEHFVIQKIDEMDPATFLNNIQSKLTTARSFKDSAIVFVHGFNVSFDEAVYSAAQIAWDINFDGLVCIYSWPSMSSLSVYGYTYDSNSAAQSREYLSNFLDLLTHDSNVKNVHIVAHSMGNLALVEALRLKPAQPADEKLYAQIILAAPDMDRDNFGSLAKKFPEFARGVTMYASSNDKALTASKQMAGDIARAGDVPVDGPVVTDSIDTIDASSVSDYLFGLNHSYFASDRTVITDIGQVIATGVHPPTTRNPTFKSRTKQDGKAYWLFPN